MSDDGNDDAGKYNNNLSNFRCQVGRQMMSTGNGHIILYFYCWSKVV